MFVDDIKIIDVKGLGHIKKVKLELATAFELVEMSPISFYLELNVERDLVKNTLKLLESE